MTTQHTTNHSLAPFKESPKNRYEKGRAQRGVLSHEHLIEGALASLVRDPISILSEQNKTQQRLESLIPLRFGRMSYSPFTFFRGAAALQAYDLSTGPRTSLWVELCGDAHIGNFRWFNCPDRQPLFDLNDFDETLPGPFEWDIMRLSSSISVLGLTSGLSPAQREKVTMAALSAYNSAIHETAQMNPLDLFYYRFRADAVLEKIDTEDKQHRKWKESVLSKAARKNSMKALKKLTEKANGRLSLKTDEHRMVRIDEDLEEKGFESVSAMFVKYKESLSLDKRLLLERFSLVDIVKKVVGVGSVGTRCYIALLMADDGTPLFLQFKQANSSVLEPYLGSSQFLHAGQRVVEGQRLIQAASDQMLGWSSWNEKEGKQIDFYFRQLWDGKGKIRVEELGPKRLALFAGICGKTLAFAHARSGDAMMIKGYIGDEGSFEKAIAKYASLYAEKTSMDHKELLSRIDAGYISVVRDL